MMLQNVTWIDQIIWGTSRAQRVQKQIALPAVFPALTGGQNVRQQHCECWSESDIEGDI